MAARLDEVAEGIATLLGTSLSPEPLVVDMRNQSPVNVAFFVRALAAACERLESPLALVRLSPEMGKRLLRGAEREPLALANVQIEVVDEMGPVVELHRNRPA